MMQLEYRYPIYKRFSGVLFTGAGDFFSSYGDYDMTRIKNFYGLGLRFVIDTDEKINLRIDYGRSPYGQNIYFQFMEGFKLINTVLLYSPVPELTETFLLLKARSEWQSMRIDN